MSIVRKSDADGQLAGTVLSLVAKGPVACPSADGHCRSQWRESGGCPLVAASVATLGHVRGRGPMDTSSAQQDEVDIGRDGADAVGGTEPRPRGFPSLPEAARQPDAMAAGRRMAGKACDEID